MMSKAAPTEVSLLAMWIAAMFVPAAFAVNCTSIVVLLAAAIVVAGVAVTAKFAALVPSMVTPVIVSEVLPVLLMVNVFVKALPTFTLP